MRIARVSTLARVVCFCAGFQARPTNRKRGAGYTLANISGARPVSEASYRERYHELESAGFFQALGLGLWPFDPFDGRASATVSEYRLRSFGRSGRGRSALLQTRFD